MWREKAAQAEAELERRGIPPEDLIEVALRGGPCDGEVLADQLPVEFCDEYGELGWKYRRTGEVQQLPGNDTDESSCRVWIYEWLDD